MNISDYLINLRQRHHLSQKEMSELLGYKTTSMLSQVEKGRELLPLRAYKILISKFKNKNKFKRLYLQACADKFERALK